MEEYYRVLSEVTPLIKHNHATPNLATEHVIKRLIDLFDTITVRNQLVYGQFSGYRQVTILIEIAVVVGGAVEGACNGFFSFEILGEYPKMLATLQGFLT